MLVFSGMRNENAQAKVFKNQKEMAEQSGIKESRYSALMKGKNPTLNEIDKFCKLWNCKVQDIMEYKEDFKC